MREVVRKSVMLAALCTFVTAGVIFIYNMYILPMQNDAVQSDIRTVFYQNDDSTDPATGKKKTKALNWKAVLKDNSDIKGWINIDNTKIDYPIVQCKDDNKDYQFYLHHNHLKNPSAYGAIFIDYRSTKGLDSKNAIIHGHHMDDGSMFANLTNYGMYSGNLGFYKKTPVVRISTPKGGTQTYKIISVFKSNVDPSQGEYFDFYCNNFKSRAQFMNYIYNLRVRSLFNCPVSVNENDQIVTLVTCSYEFTNGANTFRTVVVARKCRENESPSVDVNAASLNKNPVWPQCYYSRYGGVRPTVSTFMEEYKKGKLKWYDGNADFKGSEELPTSVEPTTAPPTAPVTQAPKPTTPEKEKKYTIHIISRATTLLKKTVKKGTKVTVPTVKDFEKSGYHYTLSKWKVKGFGSKKYIGKKFTRVTVNSNVKMVAVFKKTKIKKEPEKPKPTEPPKPKPTRPPTEPQTEPETEPEAEQEEYEEADVE